MTSEYSQGKVLGLVQISLEGFPLRPRGMNFGLQRGWLNLKTEHFLVLLHRIGTFLHQF